MRTKLLGMGRVRRQLVAVAFLSLGLTAAVISLGIVAMSLLGRLPPMPGAGAEPAGGVVMVATPAPPPLQGSQRFHGPRTIFIAQPAATRTVPSSSQHRARPQPTHRIDAREARRRPKRERRARNTQPEPAPLSAPAVMASADTTPSAVLPASRRRVAARHPIRPARAQKSRPRSVSRPRQVPAPTRQVNGHRRPQDHAPPGAAQSPGPRPAPPGIRKSKPVAEPDLRNPQNAKRGRGRGPASVGPPAEEPNGHPGHGHGHGHSH